MNIYFLITFVTVLQFLCIQYALQTMMPSALPTKPSLSITSPILYLAVLIVHESYTKYTAHDQRSFDRNLLTSENISRQVRNVAVMLFMYKY